MNLENDKITNKKTILESVSIAIFGRRNVGKSSLINLLIGQNIAIVSDIPGTTTDPVRKRTEISEIGIVSLIDTAGIDDVGEIGSKRVGKSLEILKQTDFAILLISNNLFESFEIDLIKQFDKYSIPYIILHNKNDLVPLQSNTIEHIRKIYQNEVIEFSTLNEAKKDYLIKAIKELIEQNREKQIGIFDNLVKPNDLVLLITPIDESAPKGRLILPQNQSIRKLLDESCITVVIKDNELDAFLSLGIEPHLVVTDSKVFDYVADRLPPHISLTSFSILFARQKGDFEKYIAGTHYLSQLKDNDQILILESCTHHSSCDDIGRVKIPSLLRKLSGKELKFDIISGLSELPKNVSKYNLAIQCGGCMVTRKQLLNRLKPFIEANIPITNYGMTLAYVNGIFERAIEPLISTNRVK